MRLLLEDLLASVGTRTRRRLLTATVLTGVIAAAAPDAATGPDTAGLVQSTLSILLPFVGILVVQERVRDDATTGRILITAGALGVVALAVAVLGLLIAATRVVASGGVWTWTPGVIAATGEVQLVSVLIGVAFGLLFRRAVTAMVADVVVPLGLWALSGALGATVLQAWTTPYAVARDLLSGAQTATSWARAGVVVLLWVVLLGGTGLGLLARRKQVGRARATQS